ncbi:MAG: hypothetical protein ACFN9G_08875 [Cardiobacterium sp.]
MKTLLSFFLFPLTLWAAPASSDSGFITFMITAGLYINVWNPPYAPKCFIAPAIRKTPPSSNGCASFSAIPVTAI